MNILSV